MRTSEYTLLPKVISQADVHLRLQRAKPWVTSWLAARGIAYADIPPPYKQDFAITELDYLSFPLSTIYAMVEQREIPFKRFGKKAIRFDRNEIDLWVDEHCGKSNYVA